jgi:hypothetical protein
MTNLLPATAFALTLTCASALAHSWYPNECCNDADCHPVPCEQITQDKFGYYWHGVHFTWSMDRGPSEDGSCHVCITQNTFGGPYPHCIFTGGIS